MTPGSPNPDPISDQKIVIFHTRFQIWTLKSIPFFRLSVGRNYVIIFLRLECQQKDFLKSTSKNSRILLFLSYSFGIETTNTFMHSLENHTRFQTKRSKVYTRFQTMQGAKTIPFRAAHTYKANGKCKGVTPPPPLSPPTGQGPGRVF